MSEFGVIDAHVHLWNPNQFPMSWLSDHEILNRSYGLEDYFSHSQHSSIEALVYIEVGVAPQWALLEARQIAKLAEQEPRLKGIVAAAPLEYGLTVRTYLEALTALGPAIKGVRRNLQGESDTNFCLQPNFVQGVQLLPDFGLSFDICIYHYQLPGIIELVKRCPQTSFVLDHIAKPAIKSGEINSWQAHIRELAAFPNVVCKLSGLVTEADHAKWSEAALEPYVSHILEVFGEERVLFGSDWPVALLASSYSRWVETLEKLTSHLSEQAKRKLWAENARRCYRL